MSYLTYKGYLGTIEPDQPFNKGTFNVRISPELHRQAVLASGDHSHNAFVSDAIQEKLVRLGV